MNTSTVVPFDYSIVLSETAVKLQARGERIKMPMQKTTEDIIEIGRDLLAVKEHLGHGQFVLWVETGVGILRRSAQNYMRTDRVQRALERNRAPARRAGGRPLAAPAVVAAAPIPRWRPGRWGAA
jgi:hypothetical protein